MILYGIDNIRGPVWTQGQLVFVLSQFQHCMKATHNPLVTIFLGLLHQLQAHFAIHLAEIMACAGFTGDGEAESDLPPWLVGQ